jgi:hypothetical protein
MGASEFIRGLQKIEPSEKSYNHGPLIYVLYKRTRGFGGHASLGCL